MKMIHGKLLFALRKLERAIVFVILFSAGSQLATVLLASDRAMANPTCDFSPSQTQARFELTPSGVQKIVGVGLQIVLPELLEDLVGTEFGDWKMATENTKCMDQDNYVKLAVTESWADCYGFPRFFTGEGIPLSQLKLAAMPEPSSIEFLNLKLKSFEFGRLKLRCRENGCHFDVPIKSMLIEGDLLFTSLWTNKTLFYAKQLYLKLSKHGDQIPFVKFSAPLDPVGGIDGFLDVARNSAKVYIPAGSLELESKLNKEQRAILLRKVLKNLYSRFKRKLGFPSKKSEAEIIRYMLADADAKTYKSEEYKQAFTSEIEKEFGDYFGSVSSLASFHFFTQLTTPEMQKSERVKALFPKLSNLLAQEVIPLVIDLINEGVKEVPLVQAELDYSFPMIRTQDYVDGPKQELSIEKHLILLKEFNQEVAQVESYSQLKAVLGRKSAQNPVKSLAYKSRMALNMFEQSTNLGSLQLVDLVTRGWKTILLSLEVSTEKLLQIGKSSNSIRKLRDERKKVISKIVSDSQDQFIRVLGRITDHQIQLKMRVSTIQKQQNNWLLGLSMCDGKSYLDIPGKEFAEFQQMPVISIEEKIHDGRVQVGLGIINEGIKRHFKKNLLKVCKNSSKMDICDNQDLIAKIEKIEIVELPKLKYDPKRQQLYIKIPKLIRKKSVLGSNVLGEILPFVGAKAWGGKVYLEFSISEDRKHLDIQVTDLVGDIKFNDTSIFGVITSLIESATFFIQEEILERKKSQIMKSLSSDINFPAVIQFNNVSVVSDSVVADIEIVPEKVGGLIE